MTVGALLALYICFRIKHFLGDYLLQTPWMATTKGGQGPDAFVALMSHAGIHAFGTFIIMLMFKASFWWLALVDLIIHATIDRIKMKAIQASNVPYPSYKYFLITGLDQEAHHFTHLFFIILVVLFSGDVRYLAG